MNVFRLRQEVLGDFASYVRSFQRFSDERIADLVERALATGHLWPEALVQLNPAFEPGGTIDQLVEEGVLHPGCRQVFRRKSHPHDSGQPLHLFRHQSEAIRIAAQRKPYVLTTGTGSGKSLTYIVPIVDAVLRRGRGHGVRAVIVYPLNALANSQERELEKFLRFGFPDGQGPVTFRRYTGQENDEEKQAIIADPPDILLTNYVMLELLLTRPRERPLIAAARGLDFLVLDELHTYRGRSGADVALLVRRAREAFESPAVQLVGTSATLATGGAWSEQRQAIATVASRLFGATVEPDHVVGESLARTTADLAAEEAETDRRLAERLRAGDPPAAGAIAAFLDDPLARWLETRLGLEWSAADARWIRAVPRSIRGARGLAAELSRRTGIDEANCEEAIERTLLRGFDLKLPGTDRPLFAFRLHQFIGKGETVWASLEPEHRRQLTLQAQQFVPDGTRGRLLFPLAFCRDCGQEYYTVFRQPADLEGRTIAPRALSERQGEEGAEPGFLFASERNPWPLQAHEQLDRLPVDWLEEVAGVRRVRKDREKYLPQKALLGPGGGPVTDGALFWWLPAPFRLCLACGVSYPIQSRASDFGRLATLSSEGRSTATSILSLSVLQRARDQAPELAKVLSFTDNRQDASLQAGHLNDFAQVAMLRSALCRAVALAGAAGLKSDEVAAKVADELALPFADYAADPTVKYQARLDTDQALREVLAYRIFVDLRRGWRITSPNLEQCGLLRIEYASLDDLCRDDPEWSRLHPALAEASAEVRHRVATTLLDHLRRELAILSVHLAPQETERLRSRAFGLLRTPWGFDEDERLERSSWALPRPRGKEDDRSLVFLSPRGGLGQYLRRASTFPEWSGGALRVEDSERILRDLLQVLRNPGGILVEEPVTGSGELGYQVKAQALLWRPADGSRTFVDPIRTPRLSEEPPPGNPYFVALYKRRPQELLDCEAREHTAQVPKERREKREELFRDRKLPLLFCSPTMELGIDIADLNFVHLRNVPPTPANYAQRSGRAGRSGSPALVTTYCSTSSSHDQYFFRRPERMVQGVVAPPRLDLANEDLLAAHVHAIWLAETGVQLGQVLSDLLDLTAPGLPILAEKRERLARADARERARQRAHAVLATLAGELAKARWWTPDWVDRVLDQALPAIDRAADRWRSLYRAAREQADLQHRIQTDPTSSPEDRKKAESLHREAIAQLDLLTSPAAAEQSDFYSYRYFASEGFLPGYSFPRLPLAAFIPGRRRAKGEDEFLSRPRFLAISEFGPQTFVYHEGSRYKIHRVLLPLDREEAFAQRVKRCGHCGYLHPFVEEPGPDLCEQCGAELGAPIRSLFRLQNVSTRRKDRINSDEEERSRLGYELATGVRFSAGGAGAVQSAEVAGGLGRLVYSNAATLWRLNLGWKRRARPEETGFLLDLDRGTWERNVLEEDDDDPAEPMSKNVRRVIPYVEDRRNALLFTPGAALTPALAQSLVAALKNALQVDYQLEDSELAAEVLPDPKTPGTLLLYEAAEGGAGVLRHLVEEPAALAAVARRALELCHFDPENGEDRGGPPAGERCEAACYDCLMTYSNQRFHALLDRQAIREPLLALARAAVAPSPTAGSRSEHLERLRRACGSSLEREWLDLLEAHRLRLPSDGQRLLPDFGTRPDFEYRDELVLVYVDGPDHDAPGQRADDQRIREALTDAGYQVLDFRYDEKPWEEKLRRFPNLFGEMK